MKYSYGVNLFFIRCNIFSFFVFLRALYGTAPLSALTAGARYKLMRVRTTVL